MTHISGKWPFLISNGHFHEKRTHFRHLEQSLGTLVWIFRHLWWYRQNHKCIDPKMLPFSNQYYFCQNRRRRICMLNLRFRNNPLEYGWSIRVIKYLSIFQYDQLQTIFHFYLGSKCANLTSPIQSGRHNRNERTMHYSNKSEPLFFADRPLSVLWTVHFDSCLEIFLWPGPRFILHIQNACWIW